MHTAAPEEVGLSSERLARISTRMQHYIDEEKFAGIVTLVSRYGQVAHFEACGMQNIGANIPMALDTVFRIYSMTKPIISVAIMMLFEQGRFLLTDPVSEYIPAFKKLQVCTHSGYTGLELHEPNCNMTLQHLLAHTAGLSYGIFEDSPVEALYRDHRVLARDITLEDMIDRLADIPLMHHPGEAWRYSVATDVLGYLVQTVADMPLEDFLRENILHPLGMYETGFHVTDKLAGRFAAMYGPEDSGGLEEIDSAMTSDYLTSPRRPSGGAGLVSTTSDYLRFTELLLNNGELEGIRLLSRKSIELMTSNHLPDAIMPIEIGGNYLNGYGFGLGFRVMLNPAQAVMIGSEGEFGWSGAANTHFWVDPKESMIGILMTQFMPSGHYPLTNDFRVAAYQSIVD